jgi:hypothetical protein
MSLSDNEIENINEYSGLANIILSLKTDFKESNIDKEKVFFIIY